MDEKIKKSYKRKIHLKRENNIDLCLTTKAKSKHFVSFTYHIEDNGKKLRDIHNRVKLDKNSNESWIVVVSENLPNIQKYVRKNKKKNIEEFFSI